MVFLKPISILNKVYFVFFQKKEIKRIINWHFFKQFNLFIKIETFKIIILHKIS